MSHSAKVLQPGQIEVLEVATGIEGFDDLIEAGIPKGSLVLLAGDAGSGKTILAAQYLYHGASRLNEHGIYASLAEDRETFLENMKRIDMDFEKLEQEGKFQFLEYMTASEKGVPGILTSILKEIGRLKAKRLVIDSFTAMTQAFKEPIEARTATHMILGKMVRQAGCTTVVLCALNIETTFEPPYLAFILNTLFITLASFIVAYVSAWSYLLSSSRTLNLMGAAVLMFGLSISLAGLLVVVNVNAALAIFNICALVSGILQTITALVRPSTSGTPSTPRRLQLTITYVGAVGVVALVTIASLSGNVPAFIVPGEGFTILRQAVIGMATVLFGLSSTLFMRGYSKSRTPILYWYSLALAMTAVGLLDVTIAKVGTPLGWTGRTALYSGGIYFLIAVLRRILSHRIETPCNSAALAFPVDDVTKTVNDFSLQRSCT